MGDDAPEEQSREWADRVAAPKGVVRRERQRHDRLASAGPQEPAPKQAAPKPKPPAEKVVDHTARAEREWVKVEAEARKAEFEVNTRRKAIAHRRAQRKSMTLLQRHARVLAELARLSTVPAGSVAPGRGGGDSQILIGTQQLLEREVKHPKRLMEIAVTAYEAVLDEQQGLGVLRSIDSMITEEKDALICDPQHQGWSPSELEVIYQGKLGSATTIRRVRRKRSLSPHSGIPLRFDLPTVREPNE